MGHKFLRRLFYTAAAISTVLLLTTLILWPVSYYRERQVTYVTASGPGCGLGYVNGRTMIFSSHYAVAMNGIQFGGRPVGQMSIDHWGYLTWRTADDGHGFPTGSNTLGIFWGAESVGGTHYTNLLIPFSYLALLFSLLPLLAFRSIRRRRKQSRIGLCPKCGYDLRAHGAGARCPECGTPVAR